MRTFRSALLVAMLAISGAACGDGDDDTDIPEVTESADLDTDDTGDEGTDGTGDTGDGAGGTDRRSDTDAPGNKSPGPAPEGGIYDDQPSVAPDEDQ